MINPMNDLMKQFSDNAVKSAQRVTELNMKTFETLNAKQSELMSYCIETSTKNAEALSKAKDPQEALTLQQETLKSYGEKLASTARETTDLLSAARNEWTAFAEDSAKSIAQSNEQAVEFSKQAFNDGVAKSVEVVEQSAAKGAEMTEAAVAATKDAADKAMAMGKEGASKVVSATKKAAKKTAA